MSIIPFDLPPLILFFDTLLALVAVIVRFNVGRNWTFVVFVVPLCIFLVFYASQYLYPEQLTPANHLRAFWNDIGHLALINCIVVYGFNGYLLKIWAEIHCWLARRFTQARRSPGD